MTASTSQALPAAAAEDAPDTRRRWLILWVAALAQLMVGLDTTIVNIALPSAQKALGFANTDRQWIVTAYALAFGSLLLLGGKLGDLFGRKAVFITGMAGFALASAAGGAAQSFGVLVRSRALQGAFGALLAPAVLSTLATTFTDSKERSRAFGIFGAVAGGGSAVGLLLGGVLTETLSWRYCFYVNVVLAAGAIVGAVVLLQNDRGKQRPKLDIPGTLLSIGGLFCLVYGFSNASTGGWGDRLTLISLAAGVLLMIAFVLVEQRVTAPLLPLRIVLDRVRGASYLAFGLSSLSLFGVFLFLSYYLQGVKGFSPIQSGVAFLPLAIGIVVASTLSNVVLLPKTGPRPLIPTGMVMGAIGMFILSRLTPTSGYFAHVFPALVILGLGFGLIVGPSISSATLGATQQDAGIASAMVNTMQQIGGSIGVALLSTLAVSTTAHYGRSHHGVANVAMQAQVHGYTTAFLASAAVFLFAAVLTALLLPSGVLANPAAPDAAR
jgi:EmrB/QacA subfamily drug resistance transporter